MKKHILAGALFALAASTIAAPPLSASAADWKVGDALPTEAGDLGNAADNQIQTNKQVNANTAGIAENKEGVAANRDEVLRLDSRLGTVDKNSPDSQRWQKPDTLVTDAQGFVLGKDGQPLDLDGTGEYRLKANADKTGFEMSAFGPTLYGQDGEKTATQLPAVPGVVPDSPLAKDYAGKIAGIAKSGAQTRQSNGTLTAVERIDANSSKIDANNKDIVNVDSRLQRVQNEWKGTSGQFGQNVNGDNLTATDAINQNQDDIQVTKDRLAGENNAAAWGKNADGTAKNLEQGFGELYNNVGKNTADITALDKHTDVGANEDGSKKTVREAVDEAREYAKDYADFGDDVTLVKANTYTDGRLGNIGGGTVADRINDLNSRFDTGMAQNKAYIDRTAAQTLRDANGYTDQRYGQLNSKIKKLRGRVDSGVAGATAIAGLTFNTDTPNSISGAIGVSKNKAAGAIGYQRNFSGNWRARGTVSVSDNYTQGSVGIGKGW